MLRMYKKICSSRKLKKVDGQNSFSPCKLVVHKVWAHSVTWPLSMILREGSSTEKCMKIDFPYKNVYMT